MSDTVFRGIQCVIIACFILVIVIQDIKEYKIKNKTVAAMLCISIALKALFKGGAGVGDGIIGMLIPMVLFPLFALRMLGAGDIKALCAIGFLMGAKKSFLFLILSILTGGVIAVIFLVFRRNAIERFRYLWNYIVIGLSGRSISSYMDKTDKRSLFRFSYGIAGGYCVYLIMNLISCFGG